MVSLRQCAILAMGDRRHQQDVHLIHFSYSTANHILLTDYQFKMNQKESALSHEEYDPYHHRTFASYDSQEEYYKKMA